MYIRDSSRASGGSGDGVAALMADSWLGDSGSPQAAVRIFHCTSPALAAAARTVGRSVRAEDLRRALEKVLQTTIQVAQRAAASLDRGARTPEATATFQAIFGVPPSHVPAWRPPGQRWDLGAVVRRRYLRAAEILGGGQIRFQCSAEELAARADSGEYRIDLGPAFWKGLFQGQPDGAVYMLLLSGLQIYFGPRLHHGATGPRTERTTCHAHFALARAGLQAPSATLSICSQVSSPTSTTPVPPIVPAQRSRPSAVDPVDVFPREVIERIAAETPEQRINRIILETPPGPRPRRSLSGQAGAVFGQAVDRIMERAGVPPGLRPLIRQAAKAAVQKGSDLLMEKALDSLGIRGDPRKALESSLESLWRQAW
jgi:hypothetical protein